MILVAQHLLVLQWVCLALGIIFKDRQDFLVISIALGPMVLLVVGISVVSGM